MGQVKQPHEVRLLDGGQINWANPPAATDMCSWSKRTSGGGSVRVSLRTLAHLNRLNNLATRKYGTELVVIQPDWNTTVKASAGTHDYDSVWDLYIPGVDWWGQQRFFRANGFGCWYRHPPSFGNHIHGFTLPVPEGKVRGDDFAVRGFKVGVYVPGQLEDYYNHAFGLSNQHTSGSDRSWFPADIESTVFKLGAYIARRAR
jgi:hypothetical protein